MRTVPSSAFQFIQSDTEVVREIARKLKQAASELDQAQLPNAYFNYRVQSSAPHLRRGIAYAQTGGVNYTLRSYASVLRRYASDVRATSNRIEDASEAFEKCESRLKQRNVLQSAATRAGTVLGKVGQQSSSGTISAAEKAWFSFLIKAAGLADPVVKIFSPLAEFAFNNLDASEFDAFALYGALGKMDIYAAKQVTKLIQPKWFEVAKFGDIGTLFKTGFKDYGGFVAKNATGAVASGVFSGVAELVCTGFENYGKVVSGEMEVDNAVVNTVGAGATAFAVTGLLTLVAGPAAPAIYLGLDTGVKWLTGDSIAGWGGKGLEAVWDAGEAAGRATGEWLEGLGQSVGKSAVYKEATQIVNQTVDAVQTGFNTIANAASEAVSNVRAGLTTVCNWLAGPVFA